EQKLLEERYDARIRENARLELALKGAMQSVDATEDENRRLVTENAALLAERPQLIERIGGLGPQKERLRDIAAGAARQEAELRARLEETARSFAEKEALFKETSNSLKQEFQLLANRIFEEQGQSFARNNRTQLDSLLAPFREQIAEF